MLTESLREKLYQDLEITYPFRPARETAPPREVADPEDDVVLSRKWQQELTALQEQLLTRLLFQLHTLFDFAAEDHEVRKAVREAVEHIYGVEESCSENGSYDVNDFALSLLRKHWHETANDRSHSLLSGLAHLDQAGFFRKEPREIASWAKRFLMIERYHRLDARESENRLERFRALRSQQKQSLPLAMQFEDLVVWLEFRLLGETFTEERDIGLLTQEIAQELEGDVSPDVLCGDPLQPLLYVLLKCHRFCLSETIEPTEQRRLEQLFATRQLDSLVDLMRVLIHRTTREHRLPEVGTVLDQLQSEGYNINHQGFGDPYEARLVPIGDTEHLETARLPLFFPLEALSGKLADDLTLSRQKLLGWQRRIVSEIVDDCDAYALALVQPLPKANLIHRLIRFSVSWALTQSPWPVSNPGENFAKAVAGLLPENVIRQLIRPRKGYEIKSRLESNLMIEAECRRQWEALDRIASSHRIQGYHDYTQFTRYVVFQYIKEEWTEDPRKIHQVDKTLLGRFVQPEWIAEAARMRGIETTQVHPHTLERIQQYIMEAAPREKIREELETRFETSENELNRVYNRIVEQTAPIFHLLLVAYGRHRADLPRPSASITDISRIVQLLATPLSALQEAVSDKVKQDFDRKGISLYRNQLNPYLLNAAEWKAYIAWKTLRRIRTDVTSFFENRDLDSLLSSLEQDSANINLPPDALTFETVRSTLVELFRPPEGTESVSDSEILGILTLLPQLDCAGCGHLTCREFAGSLLKGRGDPSSCLQLPASRLPALVERLSRLKRAVESTPVVSTLDLLRNRRLWKNSPDKAAIQNALSVRVQKTRLIFMERLKSLWENLSPKPQIFKHPGPETIYRRLCRYMGYEATERLRTEERAFLIEHGDERQRAEWQALKQRQDWLAIENRNRQSGPMVQSRDPRWLADLAYGGVFFLHQLGPRDRNLVLRYRFEQHQEGFSHWWNEDLLTMNLPDFSIRDWEDFSKIIKNAYWHQESSPAAEDIFTSLENELSVETTLPLILDDLVSHWIQVEGTRLLTDKNRLESFRGGQPRAIIRVMADLRELVRCLVEEEEFLESSLRIDESRPRTIPLPVEDQLRIKQDDLWEKFQNENFIFSPTFSCLWEELLPGEVETLKKNPLHGQKPQEHSMPSESALHKEDSTTYLGNWAGSLEKRSALILAVISAAVGERHQEKAECGWANNPDRRSLLPLGSLKTLIRQWLLMGKSHEDIRADLRQNFFARPELQRRLGREAILRLILARQHERLMRSNNTVSPAAKSVGEGLPDLPGFGEVKSVLDTLLDRQKTLDRDRLLHYLFLLAKMEGNLDTLTALLREIRETADMIEAAWLRFTQERIMEGPGPKTPAGSNLGIPLLASRIKDKEPINRGLREGVSRKEKKNVANAVAELLNIMRYHILILMDDRSFRGDAQAILREMENAGYDFFGVEGEALLTAIQRQWERRDQLKEQKIWIYTTVTARRLAAQNSELQEAERDFYKIRLDLLKGDGENNPHYLEIASRRGVALDQIKEEMYRRLSDLLESERIASFQKRIRQIVHQLDQKHEEIHEGWLSGRINRRTMFYLLRQYQKSDEEPAWEDFERFICDHWLLPLEDLRSSRRPDRAERIQHLDDRFRSLLGTSLLELEVESTVDADRHFGEWMKTQMESLESGIS